MIPAMFYSPKEKYTLEKNHNSMNLHDTIRAEYCTSGLLRNM